MKFITIFLISVLFILYFSMNGYTQGTKSSDDKIKTGITKVYDMFSKGDLSSLGDFIDDNMVDHSPSPGQKPGLQGLKDEMEKLRKAYPDLNFAINDMIISGDKASVLFTFSGTNTGEMMGMKPTGKKVSVQGIDYIYFKDGKATEHWGYLDMDALMQQLGYNQQK